MNVVRDLIVEVNSKHTAQIESWLLGRGRLPTTLPASNAASTEYLVEGATEQEIRDLRKVAGRIRRRFSDRDVDPLDTHDSGWGEHQQDEQ